MKARLIFLPLAGIAIAGGPAYATVYLSVEQAQAILFPGATFQKDSRTLTEEQVKAIEHASGVHVLTKQSKSGEFPTAAGSSSMRSLASTSTSPSRWASMKKAR